MEGFEILENVADTITEELIIIEVGKHKFEVKPASLGTLIKISKKLIRVDLKLLSKDNVLQSSYEIISQHAEKIAAIIALAVLNQKENPSPALINFFCDNLSHRDLLSISAIILKQLKVADFNKYYRLDKCTSNEKTCKCDNCKRKRGEPVKDEAVNNLWQTVGFYRKYFKASLDDALWKMSYANFIMDLASIPKVDEPGEPVEKETVVEVDSVEELAKAMNW